MPVQSETRQGQRKRSTEGQQTQPGSCIQHLSASRDEGCAAGRTVIIHHGYMCSCDYCDGGNRARETEALGDRAFESSVAQGVSVRN